jgi:hypothetical protein
MQIYIHIHACVTIYSIYENEIMAGQTLWMGAVPRIKWRVMQNTCRYSALSSKITFLYLV